MDKMITMYEKPNKEDIPVCNIMGVNIAAIDMEWLIAFTNRYIRGLMGQYMCVSNVHTTVSAYKNDIYNQSVPIWSALRQRQAKCIFRLLPRQQG